MSRTVKRSGRFKKDFKRFRHDAVVVSEFTRILSLLIEDCELPEKYSDHPLHNNWEGLAIATFDRMSFSSIASTRTCSKS